METKQYTTEWKLDQGKNQEGHIKISRTELKRKHTHNVYDIMKPVPRGKFTALSAPENYRCLMLMT